MQEKDPYETLKLENHLCFPLYACSRKIVNLYTPYLKQWGLTYTQYLVFLVLWNGDNIPVGEMCRRLYLDSGTLTPLLKNLERNGYVRRQRWKEDERVVLARLTETGEALREQALSVPQQVGSCLKLPQEEAAELYRLLYKLLGSLDEK